MDALLVLLATNLAPAAAARPGESELATAYAAESAYRVTRESSIDMETWAEDTSTASLPNSLTVL